MTKANKNLNAPLMDRTSAGLRDAIFDEIDAVRNGISNPTRANAIAKLASGVVETVRMELEVVKASQTYVGENGFNLSEPRTRNLQLGATVNNG